MSRCQGVRLFVWLGVNLLTVFLLRLIHIINFVSKLCANIYFSTAYTVVTHAIVIVVATFPPHTHTHKHTDVVYVLAILCLFIEFMPLSLPTLRRQTCQASAINAS